MSNMKEFLMRCQQLHLCDSEGRSNLTEEELIKCAETGVPRVFTVHAEHTKGRALRKRRGIGAEEILDPTEGWEVAVEAVSFFHAELLASPLFWEFAGTFFDEGECSIPHSYRDSIAFVVDMGNPGRLEVQPARAFYGDGTIPEGRPTDRPEFPLDGMTHSQLHTEASLDEFNRHMTRSGGNEDLC